MAPEPGDAHQDDAAQPAPRFDEFVERGLHRWWSLARSLSHDSALAQDLVQDVIIKLHRRWSDVASMDHREAYVRRMIVNEYLSWRRRFGRVLTRPDHDFDVLDERSDHAAHHAERAALRDQIATLPRQQRAVITLRYLEQLDDAEIAEILGCTTATVRSHASRALATLRVSSLAADYIQGAHR